MIFYLSLNLPNCSNRGLKDFLVIQYLKKKKKNVLIVNSFPIKLIKKLTTISDTSVYIFIFFQVIFAAWANTSLILLCVESTFDCIDLSLILVHKSNFKWFELYAFPNSGVDSLFEVTLECNTKQYLYKRIVQPRKPEIN